MKYSDKPIEVGCKCVVVNITNKDYTHLDGKIIVTILAKVGKTTWQTDYRNGRGGYVEAETHGLRRIDDDDEQEREQTVSWDDCVWSPHRQGVEA